MRRPRHDPPLIWLLCGGPSSEYEVSLSSAQSVALSFDRAAYQVRPVCLRPALDGQPPEWWFARTALAPELADEDVRRVFEELAAEAPGPRIAAAPAIEAGGMIRDEPPDCALIMIHGAMGEDGTLQGLFEVLGVPYTGSGVLACALSMDKILCQDTLERHGVRVPPRLALARRTKLGDGEAVAAAVEGRVGYPCFVKPASGGSSIGMSLVERAADLMAALHLAERYDNHLLIEARIPGMEVTCAVMDLVDAGGTVNTVAFPPTEIAPKAGVYFDYACKYTPGNAEEITPARLEPEVANEVRATALRVHSILGCEGFSRVDMLVDGDRVYVIELNAVPGMTPTSLFPQGAEAYGLSFAEVLDQFIRYAWWRQ